MKLASVAILLSLSVLMEGIIGVAGSIYFMPVHPDDNSNDKRVAPGAAPLPFDVIANFCEKKLRKVTGRMKEILGSPDVPQHLKMSAVANLLEDNSRLLQKCEKILERK